MDKQHQELLAGSVVLLSALMPFLQMTEAGPQGEADTYFAFVKEPAGEPIYKDPGNTLIDRVSFGTYLGALTGNESGQYREVVTPIDGQARFFWIDENGIEKVKGVADTIERNLTAPKKKQRTLRKIIAANA